MNRTAIEILDAAYAAAMQIVDKHTHSVADDARIIAASNLAICLFSFEAEAASLSPLDGEDDETIEGE